MANAVVGEINISLGGREFTLRPSFFGLAEIEARSDCGLLEIAQEIAQGKIKLKHVVAMVYGGIVGATARGQKPEITYEECGELIVKENYLKIVPALVTWFGKAIQGDPDNQPTEKKT